MKNQKTEVRSQKSEVRSQKSEAEVMEKTGLSADELKTASFMKIMERRNQKTKVRSDS